MSRGAPEAPVTDWRDTIKGYRGRKRTTRWGWVVLLACIAGLIAYQWGPWRSYMDFRDVTIETWTCTSPLPDNPSFTLAKTAGCTLGDSGVQVLLREEGFGREKIVTTVDGTLTLKNVPLNSPALTLEVHVPDGASGLVLANGEPNPPVPMTALNGDAQGLVWTQLFRPDGHVKFVLFVGPRP